MSRWIFSALFFMMVRSGTAGVAMVPDPSRECVFVLHGLARGTRSMAKLSKGLSAAGYCVHNVDYPSTSGSFPEMVSVLSEAVKSHRAASPKIHFVAYSLGAIVVRGYLKETSLSQLGRVVMIAPPNQGSEIADSFRHSRVFVKLMGSVATQLGTSADDLPRRLGAPHYPLGVIAGDRWINPLGWILIRGTHDGTVSAASAQLEGMTDFILVHHTHTFIMNAPVVADQTIRFLREGSFEHKASRPSVVNAGAL